MKYKIFNLDENGRIYFTKENLENLMDEVYNEGYEEGKKAGKIQYVPYPQLNNPNTTPNNPLNPYITWQGPNDVPTSITTASNLYSTNTNSINTKGE